MNDSRKTAATPSDKFSCFFQTDASKPKPKAPRPRPKVDKLAEPKTARASKTPLKAKSPVVIEDSDGSVDEEAMESQAVTPVRRLIRTKRAATQDFTPATKRLKSIELLVESTFDDEPAGEASPDLTTRSPAPQCHAVACRECIEKWRTNPSWVCEMAESGKRPCLSCEADGVECSDDMLEESRTDVQRVHEMAHRHRLGLAVNPEEWRTGLSGVLSSLQTFNAWQRARAASLQVKRVAAEVERHMREERAENKALKEALEEEKCLREKLEGQVKAMQAQINGLRGAKDGEDEDGWEDEVDDEDAEEGDVGEDQNDDSEG
ncbi:uncharacterized protein FTJAE_5051 [Fusarium tjaetaba]|uniref:Uncharacterized protein n=1 Tax=Fusarium tjaetaba TaxID=1567544 RepID=A0A8H5RP45_9HYPO|nr:uncharacterized protein FTJAE_5051 [Fusarium tjaetaba]KAF5638980.1 hypothetical protein FTJAE_5051 [Fusarium tjaetaba]